MSSVYIPTKSLSFEEYLTYDDGTGCQYELLETGELVELPFENQTNVLLAKALARQLERFVDWRLIMLTTTPIQVIPTTIDLPDGRRRRVRQQSRIPDLMVLTEIGAKQISGQSSGLALHHDNPALIVEFVSEGNASDDYFDKRSQYEERGVLEYWIADRHQDKVTVLTLKEGCYVEAIYQSDKAIDSQIFPLVELSASKILALP